VKFFQLLKLLFFASVPFLSAIQSISANEPNRGVNNDQIDDQIEIQAKPSIRAADLLAQDTRSLTIKVVGVTLNPIEDGIEIVLESDQPSVVVPINRSEGNTFIAEIKNAVLALPEGPGFQTANPAPGITSVSVMQLDGMTVRVSIVGVEIAPNTTVRVSEPVAAEPAAPDTTEEGEEEIIATAEQETGYRASSSTTATKTDTPLRDVPQSVQVVLIASLS
jgi:iron complex outermembrane recepter protein